MLPISKVARLPEDLRLNPFNVYIIKPVDEGKEFEAHIKEIWDSLSFLPAVFNLRFLDYDTLLENFEDHDYLVRLFKKSNIFAGVLGPRTTHVRIEIGDIEINLKEKSETEIELFLFLLQLCKSNLEVLQNIRIEFEYHKLHPDVERKLEYLTEIEKNFIEIENYLKDKLKGQYLYRVIPRLREISIYGTSRDRLRYLSMPIINHIKESDGDLSDLERKAISIGIDVPEDSPKVDPEVKILIREDIHRSRFPGIVIQKDGQEVVAPCGFSEGLFLYTCVLLYKIEDREFKKKDFEKFIFNLYDFKEGDHIKVHEMPQPLKEAYQWYEAVYDALFKRVETSFRYEEVSYRGGTDFEEWCVELLNKITVTGKTKKFSSDRDSLRQGIYRVRKSLRTALEDSSLSDVYSKVDLDTKIGEKGKSYKLYIEKENIFFPDNERWRKVVEDKSHLIDTSYKEIGE